MSTSSTGPTEAEAKFAASVDGTIDDVNAAFERFKLEGELGTLARDYLEACHVEQLGRGIFQVDDFMSGSAGMMLLTNKQGEAAIELLVELRLIGNGDMPLTTAGTIVASRRILDTLATLRTHSDPFHLKTALLEVAIGEAVGTGVFKSIYQYIESVPAGLRDQMIELLSELNLIEHDPEVQWIPTILGVGVYLILTHE